MATTPSTPGFVQGSLFEDDYLIRTLGPLAHSADVALTELVANGWDAGASKVEITIPEKHDAMLVVEDDGVGLTQEEFHSRWMKLGYNRIKHQGVKVTFPGRSNGTRLAYGRNGVGRHGLLCFNSVYTVITRSEGKKGTYQVSTLSESEPFVLQNESIVDSKGHGTRLEVVAERNLPNPDRLLDVISSRFLHDPSFEVRVNGKSVPLEKLAGLIDSTVLTVNDNISLEMMFVDTQKAARSTLYQGVVFWQGGRLVGEPSWTLGKTPVIDSRTRFAKRYTFVAKTNDLAEFVKDDWTGFKNDPVMEEVYSKVSEFVVDAFGKLAKGQMSQTKASIHEEFKKDYAELSPLGKYEVDEVIENVVESHPTANPEALSIAVRAVINLEKTRSGKELLNRLSQLSESDVEGLNHLLDQWTIKDALCVLDEIDRRVSVVEAIERLSDDSQIDELKVLHPLLTEARWLFGPEYDSSEYISNSQLRTIAKKMFKTDPSVDTFENWQKRPDLTLLKDSTVSLTGTEEFDKESDLLRIGRILIIELKRGGSNLTRDNRDQAVHYVEDFIGCKELTGNPSIFAFVVGKGVSGKVIGRQKVGDADQGHVFVTTYGQLVDTANRRLFSLRKQLTERYEGVPGLDLARRATQLEMSLETE